MIECVYRLSMTCSTLTWAVGGDDASACCHIVRLHAALLPTFVWSVLKTGLWILIQSLLVVVSSSVVVVMGRGSLCDVKPLASN